MRRVTLLKVSFFLGMNESKPFSHSSTNRGRTKIED